MSSKTIIISVVFLVIFGGLIFLFTGSQKPIHSIVTYAQTDKDRPQVQVDKAFQDIGEIKVSDVKNADFTLKNVGTKSLQILSLTSSCHCTFGQVIYNGNTSQEFGMSVPAGYITDIAPGDSAIVRVIYKPYIMPVFGLVEREVYITTNDPANQKLVFSIQMKVD